MAEQVLRNIINEKNNLKDIKFSIIMPVYNVENYIIGSIRTILNQRYRNWELICINDGSKDKSLEILERYQKRDERIKVISTENGGPARARNIGMDKATGDYILFVDSDDFLLDGALEKLVRVASKHEDADVIVYGGRPYPDNSETPQWIRENLKTRDIVYENGFEPQIMFSEHGAKPFIWLHMLKREFLNKFDLRIDESLTLGEDQAFQFKYLPIAQKIVFTSQKCYQYRWFREGSLMAAYANSPILKLEQHFEQIKHIYADWAKSGLADKYSFEFYAWILNFFYWDIVNMGDGPHKINFAKQLVEILDKSPLFDEWDTERYEQIKEISQETFDYERSRRKILKEIEEEKAKLYNIQHSETYRIGKFLSLFV